METPRLRNVLNLYLGGHLNSLRPNEFEKLRENILLDSLDTKSFKEQLQRTYDRYLTLIVTNRDNKILENAKDLSMQITSLNKNDWRRYFALDTYKEDEAQKLIRTFKALEEIGIFDK